MSAEIEEEAGCGKNRRIFEYQINFASGTEDTDQFYQIDVTSFSTSSWGGGWAIQASCNWKQAVIGDARLTNGSPEPPYQVITTSNI